jgi:hypothetical protein
MKQTGRLDSGVYTLAAVRRYTLRNVPHRFDFTIQIGRKHRPSVARRPGRAEVTGTVDVRSPDRVQGCRITHAGSRMNRCVKNLMSRDLKIATPP